MMNLFSNNQVDLEVLRKRAFNYRWATHDSDVIPLTAADPDFRVAKPIVDAIQEYSSAGYFPYGNPLGDSTFKNAIAAWYKRKKNAIVNPEFVLPVNSAAYGLFICAKTILKENENAIIPNPVDFLFRKSIEHAGAEVRTCNVDKQNAQFDLDELRSLIDSQTRAIFLCNPNNPLGKIISAEHLNAIIALAQEHNLWIVSDEIWSDIYFENPFTSILNDSLIQYNRILIVSGLSKNFALAGHRIGYIISSDEEIFNSIYQVSGHATTAFGISVLAQVAGTAALTLCDDWLNNFQAHLSKMRQLTLSFIDEIPYLENNHPDATYLAFPQVINTNKTSAEVAAKILESARVALVPGGINWFESKSEGHIRICYSTSEEILNEAFNRIRLIGNSVI
jgi:aspartate/methionine/tyrosine aminotransferase